MNLPDSPASAASKVIVAQTLTAAAFAPFGDVIAPETVQSEAQSGSRPINEGTAQRFDDLTQLDVNEQGGEACVAIFRTQDGTHVAPYALTMFERHLLGSQSFVPMGQGRVLVVVTQGDDMPDEGAIQAFIVEPGQGVTLRRGVWHHPMITIGGADVFVIERRATEVDCEIQRIKDRFVVAL
ncbi:ureidoglycolate hydrolase [Herbaspirillum sp. CF444]|uniref:ureidoglycolate lyase n=1 Tax=Herbaspirillum sp. CF444 TaxID=1144319 RepID=UPI0002725DC7|nr:ureidoglycolate lyase [Herbaspirillum sp. CF444]EJL86467.1 ureidoglycolate hydrolase [Herbaspirillum sp. CF444]